MGEKQILNKSPAESETNLHAAVWYNVSWEHDERSHWRVKPSVAVDVRSGEEQNPDSIPARTYAPKTAQVMSRFCFYPIGCMEHSYTKASLQEAEEAENRFVELIRSGKYED
jgi:hypothetical protein